MKVSKLCDIVQERSAPGVLIFDAQGNLLFCNRQAMEIHALFDSGEIEGAATLADIFHFCRERSRNPDQPGRLRYPVLTGRNGETFSIRPFALGAGTGAAETHVLALIEKVVDRRKIDIEKARREFHLTKREAQVVGLICQGLTNKEISEREFISEYTVKVHVKNIMRKMQACTRNEIFALVT